MAKPPQTPPFTCPRCRRTSHNPRDTVERYCAACDMFLDDSLRIRLWIGAKLADEQWLVDGEQAAELGPAHVRRVQAADSEGLLWLVEVWDPAKPDDEAFMRYGTDSAGMAAPYEVEQWPWEAT